MTSFFEFSLSIYRTYISVFTSLTLINELGTLSHKFFHDEEVQFMFLIKQSKNVDLLTPRKVRSEVVLDCGSKFIQNSLILIY